MQYRAKYAAVTQKGDEQGFLSTKDEEDLLRMIAEKATMYDSILSLQGSQ